MYGYVQDGKSTSIFNHGTESEASACPLVAVSYDYCDGDSPREMDARSLLRAKKAEARIEHPYASYTAAGILRCAICAAPGKFPSILFPLPCPRRHCPRRWIRRHG